MNNLKELIVFEDEDLVVFNKPIGIPVQTADKTITSIESLLSSYLAEYYIINRIDQVVSGLVLVAKNRPMASKFTRKLKKQHVNKTYFVIVEGHPTNQTATLENKVYKKGLKSFVNKSEGKRSILHYSTTKVLDNYTILTVQTETGRFHQIRCQLAHIGHPIKGDVKYGSRRSNKEGGIYLHCRSVKIINYPSEGKYLLLNAEYPALKLWKLVQTV